MSCPSSLNCMIAIALCMRDQLHRPQALGLRIEELRGIVLVNGVSQILQRRQRNAVSLVNLRDASIAQRKSHHRAEQRVISKTGAEPRDIVISPDKRDVGLLAKIIDDPVSARPAIPAIAADDQLAHRQVADEPADEVHQMEHASTRRQLVDNRREELARPLGRWRVQHLVQKRNILRRERSRRALQAVSRGQHAHEFQLIRQDAHRIRANVLRIDQRLFKMLGYLRRIKDQGQEFAELLRAHLALERFLNQRPERAGGVVDDVAQFFVLAMNVGDDVDRAFGQRQDRAEPGDLGECRVDVAESIRQHA